MFRTSVAIVSLAALGTSCLWADFSYQHTSRMSGGMMAGVMKIAGAFSKQAREPIRSTYLVKGNRMATLDARNGHIIDLDRETITEIDFEKRTYSVITFAQMAEALKQLEAKMKSQQGAEQAELSAKASVKDTGQSKQISGVNTREMILTVEMEGTDKKSGQRSVLMVMTADTWLGQPAGYDEVQRFYQRMAQKVNWMPGAGALAQGNPAVMRGMADLQKEAAKLEGIAVYQVSKFSMKGAEVPEGQVPPEQPRAQPRQAEPQEPAAVGAALGRLGGRLGGLGGLGRRKKSEPEAPPQPQAAPQAPPPAQPGEASATLMELTTELTGFSNASIDPAKFEVPAGFKQVEHQLLRESRR